MRLLNEEEKDLCKRILHGYEGYNCIQNILDSKLSNILISIHKIQKKVEILFPIWNKPLPEDNEKIIKRLNEISLLIITTCTLITLLEKEGYILIYQQANIVSDESKFGQGVGNAPGDVAHQFSDKRVSELLIEYSDKVIVPTKEFERFCNKGYIARDEQRFRRQISLAYIALAIALFAAFINLGFNLWTKFSGGTKIKQYQIESLTIALKEIQNKIDTSNKKLQKLEISESNRNFDTLKNKQPK